MYFFRHKIETYNHANQCRSTLYTIAATLWHKRHASFETSVSTYLAKPCYNIEEATRWKIPKKNFKQHDIPNVQLAAYCKTLYNTVQYCTILYNRDCKWTRSWLHFLGHKFLCVLLNENINFEYINSFKNINFGIFCKNLENDTS